MRSSQKRFVTAALLGVALLGLSARPAHAQVRQWGVYAPGINPNAPFYNRANPFMMAAPGVSMQSALINTVNQGRAISAFPPWAFGYNPYPPINFGTAFQSSGYNPWMGGGYGGGYGGGSPFLSTGYGGGYGPSLATGFGGAGYGGIGGGVDVSLSTGYNPYGGFVDPYGGGILNGAADVIFAEGRFMIQTEQARLMRNKWKVAELDYRKKAFDLESYFRANTPSYAEVKEKLDKDILRRVQSSANTGEIWQGVSQNILLRDFAKNQAKKLNNVPEIPVLENVLRHINVTKNGGNMGVLRHGGELNWPTALTELASRDMRRDMDLQARALYQQAEQTGKGDPATIKDLRTNIKTLRDKLVARVNDIPTEQYSDARRFLSDLEDAVRGVERGDAPSFFDFQKFVRGGKHTVKDVVDYMLEHGLTFAPAVEGDQGAYEALYQAMAAQNIAMNDQLRPTASTRP
jgi:hypothetical protein